MTIEEIKEGVTKTRERKRKINEETEKLKAQAAEYKRQRAEAVASGDLETFERLQHEPEATQVKINALKRETFKPLISRKDILDTWNPYIKARNKTFEKKLAAYKKARQELCAQFMELAELQRETLEAKEAVTFLLEDQAEYRRRLGNVENAMDGVEAPVLMDRASNLEQVLYNGRKTYPDVAFYIAGGELNSNQRNSLSTVLLERHSVRAELLKGDPDAHKFWFLH